MTQGHETPVFEPGYEIGPYRFERPLGRGGMGEVHLAHDSRLGRKVAIKVVRRGRVSDAETRARFLREARIAPSVVHPYVATVFDVIEHEGEVLIVMEHIEGEKLLRHVSESEASSEERLVLALEIAEALAAIHGRGLIHRDLKPGNVLVTREGHAKVVDFGLVRRAAPSEGPSTLERKETMSLEELAALSPEQDGTASVALTTPGAVLGTASYMSPEQIRGEEVDSRSDLFSFGILLYQLMTGHHPFERDSLVETLTAILHEEPGRGESPGPLRARPEIEKVLRRTLAKDPADRYASAAEAVADLRAAIRAQHPPSLIALLNRPVLRVALPLAFILVVVATVAGYVFLTTPPARAAPRLALAIPAFADRTGDEDGPLRAGMIADLLAIDLASSSLVRAVGPERTAPITAGLPPGAGAESTAQRLASVMDLDYVADGAVYRENGTYVATVDFTPVGKGEPPPPIRVEGRTAAMVAERLASRLRRSLPEVSPLTAWRDDRADLGELDTESEEAALIFQRAIDALRDDRVELAIGLLENALSLDPGYTRARSVLAVTLHRAGYGRRSRENAAAALAGSPTSRSPAARRLALEVRDVWGRVFSRPDVSVEATAELARLFPDDRHVLVRHGTALFRAGQRDEGLVYLDRARDLDGKHPGVLRARGVLLGQLGRYEEALAEFDEAARIYRLIESEEGLAATERARGDALVNREDFAGAEAALMLSARLYAEAGHEVLSAAALLGAAEVDVMRGNPRAAEARLAEAERLARQEGDLGLLCQAVGSRGVSLMGRGDFAGAEAPLREAVDLARRLENDELLVTPLSNLAALVSYLGRGGQALSLIEEALQVSRRLQAKDTESYALLLAADLRYQSGAVDEALAAYREAIDLAEEIDASNEKAWALLCMAEILERRGRLGEALDRAEGALSAFRGLGAEGYGGYSLMQRAIVEAKLGRFDAALASVEEARRIARAPEAGLEDLDTRCLFAEAVRLGREGRWEGAAEAAGRVTGMPGAESAALLVPALTLQGRALLRLGRAERAEETLRRAIEGGAGALAERASARGALAEALAERGRAGEARKVAEEALREAENMGLLLPLARSAAVLVSLPPASRPESEREIRARGLEALEEYLASAPERDRAAMAEQDELRRIRSRLEEG